jgi:hypothetical protein
MKAYIENHYSVLFALFLVVIVGLSFSVGFNEGRGRTGGGDMAFSCSDAVFEKAKIPAQVLGVQKEASTTNAEKQGSPSVPSAEGGVYVGSKNGTKYYTPGCPGSKRIKPANYIWFQSAEDATVQGYSKGSC